MSNAQKILDVLRENPHYRFTLKELSDELTISTQTLSPILSEMTRYRLIRRHGRPKFYQYQHKVPDNE